MIKIERSNKCKSYWKADELYDKDREKTFKITFFGIIILQKKDTYNCDLFKYEIENGIGFNNHK